MKRRRRCATLREATRLGCAIVGLCAVASVVLGVVYARGCW